MRIKICLYLEFYRFLGGILFKKIGTGILSSYRNQKKILRGLDIHFSEEWDDSCDILQVNTPWLNSLRLIKRARRQGKKVVIWSHVTAEDTQQVFRFAPYVFPLIKRYLAYAYSQADAVFCPSAYTKSLLLAYGLPEKKLIVVSNGVDTKIFRKDEKKREVLRQKKNMKGIVVGTVGLAIPRKGIDDFLFLAKKFPQHIFVWYGKIYNSFLVRALPEDLPGNLSFTGYVDDVQAAFNSLDVFVFPSVEENQGMVLLEAAAIGLPLLVRDIPVYRGWLRHDENCLKAKSQEEFKKYLGMLINDESLRCRLGENALKLAAENDLGRLKEKTIAAYVDLLQ